MTKTGRHVRGGRSLLVLATLLALGAAAAWAGKTWGIGPKSIQDSFRGLAALAIIAALIWLAFRLTSAAMSKAGRHRSAQSLVHLQGIAAVLVVILGAGSMLGGLQAAVLSLGLVGFGLTLALQRPILAIAGWATLVFGGSVREGDRIQVGDATGDVLDIRLFTTHLWEVGAPDSSTPGRPTGRIRTLSNAAFLENAVANSTNDTAVVFDEFVVNVAFESDQELAQELLASVARDVVDHAAHKLMARDYRRLTKGLSIEAEFPDAPFILAESKPSWLEYRLRYLVDARRAGRMQSALTKAWGDAAALHPGKLLPIYPRTQPMAIGGDGRPVNS